MTDLYFALMSQSYEQVILDCGWDKILISYAFLKDAKRWRTTFPELCKKTNVVLDSGAFTAKSIGESINIQEYAEFIQNHKDLEWYSNLDVIGSAEDTKKNQTELESLGVNPVPTFHYGEPLKFLEEYVDKYDRVCIGGLVRKPKKEVLLWLDYVVPYIRNRDPNVSIHLFGVSSTDIILRVVPDSCDSSSWNYSNMTGGTYSFSGGVLRTQSAEKLRASYTLPGKLPLNYKPRLMISTLAWVKYAEWLKKIERKERIMPP